MIALDRNQLLAVLRHGDARNHCRLLSASVITLKTTVPLCTIVVYACVMYNNDVIRLHRTYTAGWKTHARRRVRILFAPVKRMCSSFRSCRTLELWYYIITWVERFFFFNLDIVFIVMGLRTATSVRNGVQSSRMIALGRCLNYRLFLFVFFVSCLSYNPEGVWLIKHRFSSFAMKTNEENQNIITD